MNAKQTKEFVDNLAKGLLEKHEECVVRVSLVPYGVEVDIFTDLAMKRREHVACQVRIKPGENPTWASVSVVQNLAMKRDLPGMDNAVQVAVAIFDALIETKKFSVDYCLS